MPQGLEIFDAQGRVLSDTATHFGKIIGARVINSFGTGQIIVPNISGEIFTVLQSLVDIPTNVADVVISGRTISWSYVSKPQMTAMNPHVLFYGVY